ncbi:MAG TPA: Rv2993c-like domain-containing protein, partial [Solirubrobacterales bacterium]|nr:Rv2993c-like domain-containing protein [Solirubrobacterales bacterium]
MKLVTFDAGDGARAGVVEDGRVVDAWALLGEPHRGSLRELIAAERVEDLHGRLGDTGAPSHPLSAVQLLAP